VFYIYLKQTHPHPPGEAEGYVSIQNVNLRGTLLSNPTLGALQYVLSIQQVLVYVWLRSLNNSRTKEDKDCFSNGELYEASSRVRTIKNLYVLGPNAKIKNNVYQTALQ
jgi:hypothetical protein